MPRLASNMYILYRKSAPHGYIVDMLNKRKHGTRGTVFKHEKKLKKSVDICVLVWYY